MFTENRLGVSAGTITKRFGWGCAFGILALGLSFDPVGAVLNAGGVLVLHHEETISFEGSAGDYCIQATLPALDEFVTRLPADGENHFVMVYAVFPPDSLGQVAGMGFGIRYSSNVTVQAHGACNGKGLSIPEAEWPKSGSGIGLSFSPFRLGNIMPIHWFLLSSTGPGYFELTPHSNRSMGGVFGSPELVPQLEAISAYGRIGFDLEGIVPEPGTITPRGACCMEACFDLSRIECDFYHGIYLGDEGDCITEPCTSGALTGACCLPSGCEIQTWLDCVKLGGTFSGEGSDCETVECKESVGGAEGNR